MRLVSALILSGFTILAGCRAPDDTVDGKVSATRMGGEVLPSSDTCPPTPKKVAISPLPGTGPDGKLLPEYSLKLLQAVPPHYPECASLRRVDGVVDLEFTVNPDGSVKDFRVLQEAPAGFGFAQALLTTFVRWKFQPKTVNGQAMETKGYFRFRANIN